MDQFQNLMLVLVMQTFFYIFLLFFLLSREIPMAASYVFSRGLA